MVQRDNTIHVRRHELHEVGLTFCGVIYFVLLRNIYLSVEIRGSLVIFRKGRTHTSFWPD